MKQVDEIQERHGQVHISVGRQLYKAYTINDFIEQRQKLKHDISNAEYVRQCCRNRIEKTGKPASLPDGWDCAKHKTTGRIYLYRVEPVGSPVQPIQPGRSKKSFQELIDRYKEMEYDNPQREAEGLISRLPVDRTIAFAIVDVVEQAIRESERKSLAYWKKEMECEFKLVSDYQKFLKGHQDDEYHNVMPLLEIQDVMGTPLFDTLEKRKLRLAAAIERIKPDKTLWWKRIMVIQIKRILERNNVCFSKEYVKSDEGFKLLIKVLKALTSYPWPKSRELQPYQLVAKLYSVPSGRAH